MIESEHQILLMCWAKKVCLAGREELDSLVHIPNGGSRSGREGVMFKAMGVKAGVSDLFLPVIRKIGCDITAGGLWIYGGLWIEMKAEGGKVSEDQWKWIYAMRRNGYRAVVAFGWEEAVKEIKDYLGGVWPEVDMESMQVRMCGKGSVDCLEGN